ncbi:MAG: hypothetical protein RBT63_04660 [Bdellovibrionales bacterium]|jgi:hypothetical protein|nr:hypothetical protein [Bdellovibrionales bacterium]
MKSRELFYAFLIVLIALLFTTGEKVEVRVSSVSAAPSVRPMEVETGPAASSRIEVEKKSETTANENPQSIKKLDVIGDEQRDVICALRRVRSLVPMRGDVQVYASKMSPYFGNQSINVAWIKSSDCPDGRLELSRDGKFARTYDGFLANDAGCTLLNDKGTRYGSEDAGFSGCVEGGECIATLDPAFDVVDGLEYVNSFSFRADKYSLVDTPSQNQFNKRFQESVTKVGPDALRPSFFINALENVRDSERGATSVSWSNHPTVNLQDIECEDGQKRRP